MKLPQVIKVPWITLKFPSISLTKKKEIIYVALAFFTAIGGLTWVQMLYNDPSVGAAWGSKEWKIIVGISTIYVIGQTLIAWKAYLSDPNEKGQNDETKPNNSGGSTP